MRDVMKYLELEKIKFPLEKQEGKFYWIWQPSLTVSIVLIDLLASLLDSGHKDKEYFKEQGSEATPPFSLLSFFKLSIFVEG